MRRLLWVVATLLLATFVACDSDSSGPAGRPEAALRFVFQDSLAPPLLTAQDSFWAVVGRNSEIRMYYEDTLVPGDTGEEFLRFEVPGNGLFRKPDGTLFRPGDSVLITVTIVDPARFLFAFQPTGLQFRTDHPARLKVEYFNARFDFDEALIDLWRQPAPGGLWFKIGAVKFEELDELDANIFRFSRFAVAW